MSKRFLLLSLAVFLILNSIAFAAVDNLFKDNNSFEDWYAKSVQKMKDEKIITGFPDGEFKPGRNVNRAEMAVMMDRLYDNVLENMGEVLINLEELSDASFDYQWDSSSPKVALAMAMARLRSISEGEVDCDGDFRKLTAKNISEEFAVHECQSLGLVPTFFVHEKAEYVIPESGGEKLLVDQWYGPFEASLWWSN